MGTLITAHFLSNHLEHFFFFRVFYFLLGYYLNNKALLKPNGQNISYARPRKWEVQEDIYAKPQETKC